MTTNKNKLFILLGVVAVIVVIVIAAALQNKKLIGNSGSKQPANKAIETSATTTKDEIAPSKDAIKMATATPEILKEAVAVAPGTNLVTKDNKVVTDTGTLVKLNVQPSSAEAPKESTPIKEASAPTGANTVKLSVSAGGFSPASFTVKEGALVNFVLTSTDDYTHVFLFDDNSLMGAALGVAGHETRVKSWNAPKKGEYTFHCDLPGHKGRGEVGKMIVN